MPGSATLTETAELLRQAAQLVRDAGYKPWAPAGSEPGLATAAVLVFFSVLWFSILIM